jgi:tRNA pseudouridine(55) synthase
MFQGFLPIDKPIGFRSSDCVERIKRLFGKNTKVGHGGTLDSSAEGLLVLLLGGATRLCSLVTQMPKVYRATIKLGVETATCDYAGEATSDGEWRQVRESDIDALMPAFTGWRMQTPPDVSAVHVNGRRAHEIFRSGGKPDILPRPVFIERIERIGAISDGGEVKIAIRCGKGTYVRAIARDIGRRLGCFAHITSLRRESSGPFTAGDSLRPDENFAVARENAIASIKPLEFMGNFLPSYSVSAEDGRALSAGREIPFLRARRASGGQNCPPGIILATGGSMVSVASLVQTGGACLVRPLVNISKAGPSAAGSR